MIPCRGIYLAYPNGVCGIERKQEKKEMEQENGNAEIAHKTKERSENNPRAARGAAHAGNTILLHKKISPFAQQVV